jgi:argininosuccinate lyase
MAIARTDATGQAELDPEVLAYTASLPTDQALFASDVAGSLAHVTMLEESGLIPPADASQIRAGLKAIYAEASAGALRWPNEEDIHMAIEVELGRRIGEPARRLHTARSRNDQTALDSRLHLREQSARILEQLAAAIDALVERAGGPEGALLIPSYTHRQRAQPVTVGYLFSAYAQMLARDAAQFGLVLRSLDQSPLGVGAVSGTSLPVRRERVAELLGFSALTANGLDTVGDRDFALDFAYAATRCMLHLSRIATDVIDFSTQEFGFIQLADTISFGSSMMPHKKNPDLFELIRGRAGRTVGAFQALLTTVKGLPMGYNSDLQEDKESFLAISSLLQRTLHVFLRGLAGLKLRPERMAAGLSDGSTQATDLAERLVARGLAFRDAYKAVGALVGLARERSVGLAALTAADLPANGLVKAEDLAVLDPLRAAQAKAVPGGTAASSVAHQLLVLTAAAEEARHRATNVPRLATLIARFGG